MLIVYRDSRRNSWHEAACEGSQLIVTWILEDLFDFSL